MKVILKQNIKGVGNAGEVKEVSDGYARNYLFPRNLAVIADAGALKKLAQERETASRKDARELSRSREIQKQIEELQLTYIAKAGEGGRLFGSVTSKDIADQLARQGIKVDRRKILLDEPIRQLGDFELEIRLHPQVTAKLRLKVAADS
ncbi:MAG: 50S ribosomal protein L9 [Bacillota bacterium]|jgi:large subunit ribosomal protein L9